jgi:pyruvate-formate lyase
MKILAKTFFSLSLTTQFLLATLTISSNELDKIYEKKVVENKEFIKNFKQKHESDLSAIHGAKEKTLKLLDLLTKNIKTSENLNENRQIMSSIRYMLAGHNAKIEKDSHGQVKEETDKKNREIMLKALIRSETFSALDVGQENFCYHVDYGYFSTNVKRKDNNLKGHRLYLSAAAYLTHEYIKNKQLTLKGFQTLLRVFTLR